jgi:hypothetical protein
MSKRPSSTSDKRASKRKRPLESDDDDTTKDKEDDLPMRCICPICTEPRVQPFGCHSCFNSVCGACARKLMREPRPTCPHCRNPVVYDRVAHDLAGEVEERLGATAYARLEAAAGPRPDAQRVAGVPTVERAGQRITLGVAVDEGVVKVAFTLKPGVHGTLSASAQLLLPEPTPTVRVDTFTELHAHIEAAVERAMVTRYNEVRPFDAAIYVNGRWQQRPYSVFRDKVYDEALKRHLSDINVSFTGRVLVRYLDHTFRNVFSWIAAFRKLYPLVLDKDVDVTAVIHNEGCRKQALKIIAAYKQNRALAASAST